MPAASYPELDAGALDRRVTLLKPKYLNEYQDEILEYVEAGDCWASVTPTFGQEGSEAGRTVATLMVTVSIRWRADIDARWRIRDRDMEFEIKGIADITRRHVQLQLNCSEVR